MLTFHIVTLFPEAIEAYLGSSILGRAEKRNILKFNAVNLRPFGQGRRRQVDARPFGGGAGMVLMAEPLIKAVQTALKKIKNKKRTKVVLFSAKGKLFDQKMAHDWAKRYDDLVLIAGRYEGIDERVKNMLKAEEISIGRYVLTDGDVAAMAVASAVGRLVPGAIKFESLAEESHWNLLLKKEKGAPEGEGLEYPHYTRPELLLYKGRRYPVPPVLLSGDHKKIAVWRKKAVNRDRGK